MALYTLLDVVNFYADATDGFRVSTIDDGLESQQVAAIAEKVFHDLNNDLFENSLNERLIQLESLADSTKPNYMKLPTEVLRPRDGVIMYNKATGSEVLNLQPVYWKDPVEFLIDVGPVDSDTPNTQTVTDFGGYKFNIYNNKQPSCYTSFDDEHIVFDSFDSAEDSVLQASKSGVVVSIQRTFSRDDAYVIDFPEWFHPTYLNSVIAEASAMLREEPIPSVARLARVGVIQARNKQRIGKQHTKRKYGR